MKRVAMWTTLYRSTKYNNIYYKFSSCFCLSLFLCYQKKMIFFFRFCFGVNYLYFDRTVIRQEAQQREMGVGSGKVWESGLELRMLKVQQHYMSVSAAISLRLQGKLSFPSLKDQQPPLVGVLPATWSVVSQVFSSHRAKSPYFFWMRMAEFIQ